MATRRIDTQTLTNIADAVREKTGKTATMTPAEMASAIHSLDVDAPFTFGEIPDYVKAEAYAVAKKVRQVQTSKTITAIVWSDAHHTAGQVTGWQTQTNISTLHAAMGMAAVAGMCKIDFGAYCGDYTFGNGETTLALFKEQCIEMNKYMDMAYGGIPALYCVGNHDTGEYYLRDNASGALYGAETVYELIGSRNADGITVMGSTQYGYCYRDLPSKKTRVICLNTVEGETDVGYTGKPFSDTQLLWFAQTLYSAGANEGWSIFVVSHYPLDYGETSRAGNIVYQYVQGGSVTINGTTVNFSNHNKAKFVAQYHGHTHCLKVDKLHYIVNNAGTEFNVRRLATPSGTFYRNNDYAGHPIYGIEFGEDVAYTKTANSGKDTAFVVNVYDPDKEVIYSFCYGAGYDRTVPIGATVYRTITNSLTHAITDNDSISVENDTAYSATITVDSGYTMDTFSVTMGGIDITSTVYNSVTGAVNIPNVTGDVVITAVATKQVNYHNLVPNAVDSNGNIAPYQDGKSLSSSGAANDYSGYTLTGFIPLTNGVTNHIYRIGGSGISWAATDEYNRIAWYDSNFAIIKNVIPAKRFDSSVYYPSTIAIEGAEVIAFKVTDEQGNVVGNVPSSAAYFRIGAKGQGQNLIVTLDEVIDE